VTTPSDILVITGATFEADIAAGDGVITICSGADPSRLRALLGELDPDRFRAVISFGLAGGLHPTLRPGDLIIADQIIAGSKTWRTTPALTNALHSASSMPRRVNVAGAEATIMDAASKAALRAATGASAVDMESHVAAEFAASRNLPWGVLRAICDPAHRALPAIATAGLKADGQIDLAATLRSVARDPRQIPALIRTGIDTAIAVAALRRARRLLGLGFGLGGADLG
jgi:adenosylhomocysteine nucleosidase